MWASVFYVLTCPAKLVIPFSSICLNFYFRTGEIPIKILQKGIVVTIVSLSNSKKLEKRCYYVNIIIIVIIIIIIIVIIIIIIIIIIK